MGGNLYQNWGPKQRKHWNEYNKNYSKTHFKSINLKLRLKEDSDIVNYLETHKDKTTSDLVRKGIRKLIELGE